MFPPLHPLSKPTSVVLVFALSSNIASLMNQQQEADGHPIIDEPKHGRGRHNRYFKEHLDCPRLLLHAASLGFKQPITEQPIELWASLDDCWQQLRDRFDWQTKLPTELQTREHEGTHDTPG